MTTDPLFRSCRSSPWEVEKATTQARLLSGRFRLEALTGHWVPWNREGMCTLPDCWGKTASNKGTVTFFLLSCPSLTFTRISMNLFNTSFLLADPHLIQVVKECLVIDPVQFWLACSTMAPVTRSVQLEGEHLQFSLFKITRNYCHGRRELLE